MALDKQSGLCAVPKLDPVTLVHGDDFDTGWLVALPIADLAAGRGGTRVVTGWVAR